MRRSQHHERAKLPKYSKKDGLTSVDAGVGGRDAKLRFNKFGDEGDEGRDDGALCRVGQADEQEGHVAEDPQRRFGEVWEGKRDKTEHFVSNAIRRITPEKLQ